jgi:hypothetical protein
MRLKTKIPFVLLISIAFVYSACKKSTSTSAGPALTPSAVASQVAVGISSSLFGDLSGVDVSEGLGGATNFGVKHKGKVIQDTNPDCSLLIDTTIAAVTDTLGGGQFLTLSGSFKFSFGCVNNMPSSYTTSENVNIKVISPSADIDYKIGEAFTLTALTPGSQNSNLGMTGTISSAGSYSILTGNKGSGTSAFNYTLTSLVIDPTIPDILSGSASFTTNGSGPNGVWNYSGTIVFNGNQMATVTINGTAYHVNLQTGAVS